MKELKYRLMTEVNVGSEEEPVIEQVFTNKSITCANERFEANLAVAKAEAYNGEVFVEDVVGEIVAHPTLDWVESQLTYTAMMTDTLLEV